MNDLTKENLLERIKNAHQDDPAVNVLFEDIKRYWRVYIDLQCHEILVSGVCILEQNNRTIIQYEEFIQKASSNGKSLESYLVVGFGQLFKGFDNSNANHRLKGPFSIDTDENIQYLIDTLILEVL